MSCRRINQQNLKRLSPTGALHLCRIVCGGRCGGVCGCSCMHVIVAVYNQHNFMNPKCTVSSADGLYMQPESNPELENYVHNFE